MTTTTIEPAAHDTRELQFFTLDPNAEYTLEATAGITHVHRRRIAVYCRHGLVSPARAPEGGGFFFNEDGIHMLARIEFLRAAFDLNLAGVKCMLELTREVERLRQEGRQRW